MAIMQETLGSSRPSVQPALRRAIAEQYVAHYPTDALFRVRWHPPLEALDDGALLDTLRRVEIDTWTKDTMPGAWVVVRIDEDHTFSLRPVDKEAALAAAHALLAAT